MKIFRFILLLSSFVLCASAQTGGTENVVIRKSPAAQTGYIPTKQANGSIIWAAPALGVTDGDKGDVVVSSTGTAWALDVSGVTAGSYTYASITIDAKGRITSAANGTSPLNADNISSGTLADARIASTIARDSEVTSAANAAQSAAEATAANGSNISAGTVADARIASTIARDSEVTSAVSAAIAASITNGVTTSAPNQDQVYDALALKANLSGGNTITGVQTLPGSFIRTPETITITEASPDLGTINVAIGDGLATIDEATTFTFSAVGTSGQVINRSFANSSGGAVVATLTGCTPSSTTIAAGATQEYRFKSNGSAWIMPGGDPYAALPIASGGTGATSAAAAATALGLGIDASGFNGNLATTDDTIQEVAQKVDDLSLGGGSGDVVGPASATDNAVARYDTTTGKLLQDSAVTITDNGDVNIPSTATLGARIFNTVDQVTNYERGESLFVSNVFTIRTLSGGTGVSRNINIIANGSGAGLLLKGSAATSGVAVLTLPNSNIANSIGFNLGLGNQTQTSGTGYGIRGSYTINQASGTAAQTDISISRTETALGSGAHKFIDFETAALGSMFSVSNRGKISMYATVTTGGTTGDQTIDKPSGTVNIAAAGTSVTVTNALCTTSSIVLCTVRTNDTTAYIKNCVPGSGSFVITLGAAATAEVSIGFMVVN